MVLLLNAIHLQAHVGFLNAFGILGILWHILCNLSAYWANIGLVETKAISSYVLLDENHMRHYEPQRLLCKLLFH
jgi:hypothetical protein